jgi:hypothetical protein
MNSLPRRYVVNGDGHHVLVGLTSQETFEFEALDDAPLPGPGGDLAASQWGPSTGREQRWRELYAKHEGAWREWMAEGEGVHLNWLIRDPITG